MRVLFFFLILFSTAQAQIVIPSDSITIVQKNAFITFLRQENDVFFRANLTYRPYLKWYINKQNTYFINKEPDAKVLSPEKLRSSSFDEFLHKRYVIKVAEKLGKGKKVLFIAPDTGLRYLSTEALFDKILKENP